MAFKKIVTSDKNLQLIQDNVQQALSGSGQTVITITYPNGTQKLTNSTSNSPFASGNVIVTPLTASQDNLIPHGLSRTPSYWTIVRQDTDTNVWEVVTASLKNSNRQNTSANGRYLNLWCGSNCNVSLWVS